MSNDLDKEEILKARMQNIKMDLEMVDSQEQRLARNRARLIMKLVATRESLLSLKEQDE
jgi:hypothetical protein